MSLPELSLKKITYLLVCLLTYLLTTLRSAANEIKHTKYISTKFLLHKRIEYYGDVLNIILNQCHIMGFYALRNTFQ